MKPVSTYSSPRFRAIDDHDLDRSFAAFDSRDFYFYTKRPQSLSEGIITNILNGACVFTDESDNALGLLKTDRGYFYNNNSLLCEFRFFEKDTYQNGVGEMLFATFLKEYFFGRNMYFKRIMVRAYEFDNITRKFLDNLDITIDAVLDRHVYKDNRFQQLLIYAISREETQWGI